MVGLLKKVFVPLMMLLIAACGGGENAFVPPEGTTTGGNTSTTVRIGSGTGAGFTAGILSLGVSTLSAGGSTGVTANLVDANGSPYTTSTDVTFTSTCVSQGSATLTSPVTTTTGTANSTYVAIGCAGTDTITATATVGGSTISASASITVQAATLGSIQFVSATPTNIALKGTGGAGLSETSTVVFKVLNSVGGPVAKQKVNFAIDTEVGGLSINPASGETDATGLVQTIVQAGTIPTPVRVTATLEGTNPPIATQSDRLTVTTGIPSQRNISLSIETLNPEAWRIDGVKVPVTMRIADRFNNPVPDGTAVTFTAEGGSIGGSCTTVKGACSVDWVSQDARPADGRVTIMASVSGEESFIDADGNGTLNDPQPSPAKPDHFPGPPISAITRANPGVITTAIPHTLRAGELVTISGVAGMTELNGNTYFVGTVPTSTSLTLISSTGVQVDTTGFSSYTSGGTLGAFDLPESYRDDNENGRYDSGEFFVDYNKNGSYDAADGEFNGILCTHATLCAASSKLIVWDQGVIVMSDSWANISLLPTASIAGVSRANPGVVTTTSAHGFNVGDRVYISGVGGMTELNNNNYYVNSVPSLATLTLRTASGAGIDTSGYGAYSGGGTLTFSGVDVSAVGASRTVVFSVGDDAHDQPMPKGATISITQDNGKLSGPLTYTVGNTNTNGPEYYSVGVAGDGTTSTGTVTITVTAPSGVKSYATFSVKD